MSTDIATRDEPQDAERIESAEELVKLGEWFWYLYKECNGDGTQHKRLSCVVEVGSNYIKLESINGYTNRIHLNEMDDCTIREPNHRKVIDDTVAELKGDVTKLLADVKAVTARLSVGQASNSRALATLSQAPDMNEYKNALIAAKDEELPRLFREIKNTNEAMARWMGADVLPLKALGRGAEDALGAVKDRIFNVSLYAGLTEEITRIVDGATAAYDEKLRVMQAMAFMDEECLLGYRTGGMEFRDIEAFDKWLAEPANLNRILPFPRTLVAMRVRRKEKDRDWGGKIGQLLINIQLSDADKKTFFYFRNGARLYRMTCDMVFGEHIFPAQDAFANEPRMMRVRHSGIEGFMTVREYETRVIEDAEREKRAVKWYADNPFEAWYEAYCVKHPDERESDRDNPGHGDDGRKYGYMRKYAWRDANPHRLYEDHRVINEGWVPLDKSSVYYDDAMEKLRDETKHWNRIALIIQGLFDRTEVFHPHPAVKSWTAEGFAAAIELVYDGSNVIHDGPAPDFDAYRQAGLELLKQGSVVIGQDRVWADAARAEEIKRRGSHDKYAEVYDYWRPLWDAGPGYIAVAERWVNKGKKMIFKWLRNRRDHYTSDEPTISASLTVDANDLFNVDAYKAGDYLRFYRDPRTRAQYLKWAPLMLVAEEYLAGNIKPQQPGGFRCRTQH